MTTSTPTLTAVETRLPYFPGFAHNTLYDPMPRLVDDLSRLAADGEDADDFEMDFRLYQKDVAVAACEHIARAVLDQLTLWTEIDLDEGDLAFEFQRVVGLRDYNYGNDIVDVVGRYSDRFSDAMAAYAADRPGHVEAFIAAEYGSRTGFISAYPKSAGSWAEATDGWRRFDRIDTEFRGQWPRRDRENPWALLYTACEMVLAGVEDPEGLRFDLYNEITEDTHPSTYLTSVDGVPIDEAVDRSHDRFYADHPHLTDHRDRYRQN